MTGETHCTSHWFLQGWGGCLWAEKGRGHCVVALHPQTCPCPVLWTLFGTSPPGFVGTGVISSSKGAEAPLLGAPPPCALGTQLPGEGCVTWPLSGLQTDVPWLPRWCGAGIAPDGAAPMPEENPCPPPGPLAPFVLHRAIPVLVEPALHCCVFPFPCPGENPKSLILQNEWDTCCS